MGEATHVSYDALLDNESDILERVGFPNSFCFHSPTAGFEHVNWDHYLHTTGTNSLSPTYNLGEFSKPGFVS